MTVKQYLEKISNDEIRTRALRNLYIERGGDIANSIEHALFMAFIWSKSVEGHSYWAAIHHNLRYPTDFMPVPELNDLFSKPKKQNKK